MLVRDLMTTPVQTIHSDATVEEAFALLRARRIHQLPVFEGGTLVGLVTDRDLRRPADFDRLWDPKKLERGLRVSDVMTMDVRTVSPDLPVVRAARQLLLLGVGAVPVVDRGVLTGILTRSDLLRGLVALLDSRRSRMGNAA